MGEKRRKTPGETRPIKEEMFWWSEGEKDGKGGKLRREGGGGEDLFLEGKGNQDVPSHKNPEGFGVYNEKSEERERYLLLRKGELISFFFGFIILGKKPSFETIQLMS